MMLTFMIGNAQTKVYKGTSTYSRDVLCNLNKKKGSEINRNLS